MSVAVLMTLMGGIFKWAKRTKAPRTVMLVALLAAAPVLAGCVDENSDDDGTPSDPVDPVVLPGASAYTLTVEDLPGQVVRGVEFSFTLVVEATDTAPDEPQASDHIGAHYANETSDEGDLANYPNACGHQEGELPGTFEVTCTINEADTWHLRGHVRITGGDAQVNFWSDEHAVEVLGPDEPQVPVFGDYTLTVSDLPENVTANQTFNYTLTIDGLLPDESDHIGGHFGNASFEEGNLTNYPGACEHQAGDVPGTFTVNCTITEEGTFYLRGHMRLTKGDESRNYWADEHAIEVSAATEA